MNSHSFRKTPAILVASVTILLATTAQRASAAGAGTLTNEIYNDAGAAGNYTNASSITVPTTTDILLNLHPIATNYVGNNEAAGGSVNVFTDGQTASSPSNFGNASLNPNEGTSGANALFDLGAGPQPWYAEYQFTSPVNLNTVLVTSGHQDSRLNQQYDILVSTNGTTFTSLSDGSTQTTIANPGTAFNLTGIGSGFTYNASTAGHGGAAQSTVSPVAGPTLATNVSFIEFVDNSGGGDIYRELSATGTAVPEPATAVLAGGALLGFMGFRRNRRSV